MSEVYTEEDKTHPPVSRGDSNPIYVKRVEACLYEIKNVVNILPHSDSQRRIIALIDEALENLNNLDVRKIAEVLKKY